MIAMITVEHVRKAYGKKEILKDVSLQIESGECAGLLGSNGCGKSTLLSILAGVNRPDGGSFKNDDCNLFADRRARSTYLGYVPQGNPLYEELTAKDNLLLWYSRKALKNELQDGGVLKLLGIDEFLNVRVSRMSGGMKKRLSIGCSVAGSPKLLLLDEPSAALDLVCKKQIHNYLKAYKDNGGSILIVTHDVMDFELCDRFIMLKDGVTVPYKMESIDKLTKDLAQGKDLVQ